jgi:predicted NBD/HSP70 family sugar kinase
MLEVNEYLVLDLVRAEAETTRPEIATRLGLSAASVSRIVRRLVARGLVTERPGVSVGGGRPRSTIAFNDQAGCVIGVDLGGTRCHGVLADLSGSVLEQDVRPVGHDGGPFPTLLACIARMQERAAALGMPVTALAVGIPAILEPMGVAVSGPSVGWDGFPVVAELGAVVDMPFVVENDANLAALAHAWRGDGRASSEFVVLAMGTGIGAGIISGGRLLKGHRNGAGEAGFLVLDRRLLRVGSPGGRGALERLAAGPAIAGEARRRLRDTSVRSVLREHGDALTTADVFAAAARDDRLACRILDAVVEDVAMTVVAIAAITDPELVILDGAVGRALAPWRERLVELVERALPAPPSLVISTLGQDATTLGAVAAALELAAGHRPADFALASVAVQVGPGDRAAAYLRRERRR